MKIEQFVPEKFPCCETCFCKQSQDCLVTKSHNLMAGKDFDQGTWDKNGEREEPDFRFRLLHPENFTLLQSGQYVFLTDAYFELQNTRALILGVRIIRGDVQISTRLVLLH